MALPIFIKCGISCSVSAILSLTSPFTPPSCRTHSAEIQQFAVTCSFKDLMCIVSLLLLPCSVAVVFAIQDSWDFESRSRSEVKSVDTAAALLKPATLRGKSFIKFKIQRGNQGG